MRVYIALVFNGVQDFDIILWLSISLPSFNFMAHQKLFIGDHELGGRRIVIPTTC